MKAYYFKTILRNFSSICSEMVHTGIYIPSQKVILLKEETGITNKTQNYSLNKDEYNINKIEREIKSIGGSETNLQTAPLIGGYGHKPIQKIDVPRKQILKLIKNIKLRDKTKIDVIQGLENLIESIEDMYD